MTLSTQWFAGIPAEDHERDGRTAIMRTSTWG
jgi:hypothetical protein